MFEVQELVFSYLLLYFPLGVVGLWRWGVWGIKKVYASQYRMEAGNFKTSVSVVTPVYNEDPAVFEAAVKSWQANGVDEIIAVIDHTDTQCIALFGRLKSTLPRAQMIITHKPGKRAALADGIVVAKSEVVALVDSDTMWDKQLLHHGLQPFRDPGVGGVATRQSVVNPQTVAQRIFDTQLDVRYFEEMPFLTARGGRVVACVSGRTAFYRRVALLRVVKEMLHETFWGRPVISGEDKRLTYLVERDGWRVAFQQTARVFTPGASTLGGFFKQRLRWTRNSWRADLHTLTQPWVYRHPRFVAYLIDRILQPFAMLLSPLYFIISLLLGLWIPALVQLVWWHLGRLIRLYPHLKRQPRDVVLLPVYVVANFYLGVIKIYALLTLNRQGWITRWDKNRLPLSPRWAIIVGSYVATAVVVAGLAVGVITYNQEAAALWGANAFGLKTVREAVAFEVPAVPEITVPLFRYEIQPGDTIRTLATRFGVTDEVLLAVNRAIVPSRESLTVGMVLSVPREALRVVEPSLTSDHDSQGKLAITYDAPTNTIEVRGRGQQVTLAHLRGATGSERVREVAPGEWLATANIHIQTGVQLLLEKSTVRWLKLASSERGFVWLRTTNGQIVISGTTVTSWDEARERVDDEVHDGRSYILASHGSRMDISDAEIAYLGYPVPEGGPSATYGVSWKHPEFEAGRYLLTGEVVRSRFHNNFHGAYVSGGYGMLWRDNEFYDNAEYGLDLYGQSDRFLVEGNRLNNNGLHGMILAERSQYNTVQHNQSRANGGHGIILHAASDHNVVVHNTVQQQQDGIVLYGSSDNMVAANAVQQNERGVRVAAASQRNVLADNILTHNDRYGVYLADESSANELLRNTIAGSREAIYIKTQGNLVRRNRLTGIRTGIALQVPAEGNELLENTIDRARVGIRLKNDPRVTNIWGGTIFHRTVLKLVAG